MKVLKIILIVLAIIVALFLIVAAFLPSQAHIERSVTINAPVDTVFTFAADFNNFIKWDPWSRMEPEAKQEITGPAGQVGQKWAWEGEVIGKGHMTITQIVPNEKIEAKLVFLDPQTVEADNIMKFDSTAQGTRVRWIYESELDYPVGRYFGLMLDGMLGKDLESGLSNLKDIFE